MLALVPIVYSTPQEAAFWRQAEARALVARLMGELEALPQVARIVVLVHETQDLDAFHGLGPKTRARAADCTGLRLAAAHCPEDACALAGRALQAAGEHAPTDILLVDPRAIFLERDQLARAIGQFAASRAGALVSMRPVVDHPCQCQRHLKILDSGVLRFEGADKAALRAERPSAEPGRAAWCVTLPFGREGAGAPTFPIQRTTLDDSGTVEIAAAKGQQGALFALFEEVQEGPYDMACPVEPLGGLWVINERGMAARPHDRKQMQGRQDFPPLYEPDGSLAVIGRAAAEPGPPRRMKATGFVPRRGPVVVQTAADRALGQALLRLALDQTRSTGAQA